MDGGTARGLIVASLINRTYIGHVGALKDSTYNFTSTEAIFFFEEIGRGGPLPNLHYKKCNYNAMPMPGEDGTGR
jgi:hypothetical protein